LVAGNEFVSSDAWLQGPSLTTAPMGGNAAAGVPPLLLTMDSYQNDQRAVLQLTSTSHPHAAFGPAWSLK
jgi:hypothetical protein